MAEQDAPRPRPRGGLADKRRAILAGALTVFARDGYSRASIDAISAVAGVSTRTIYNHFTDKTELFQTVIQESATRAADAQVAIIDRHLRKVTDLEADLIDFGRDWVTSTYGDAVHYALIGQVRAEAAHIPRDALEAWQDTGPRRVRGELARHLRRLAGQGMLRTDDPERAAMHLLVLVSAATPSLPETVPTDEETLATVTAGVRTFLHGHLH